MKLTRIAVFAATLMTVMASAWRGVVAAVERAFTTLVETIAGPARPIFTFGRLETAGHAPTYDTPPLHSMRHEAGTAQRGAHRHI